MTRTRHKTKYAGITYRLATDDTRIYIVSYTDGEGTYRTKHLAKGSTLEQAREAKARLDVRRANGESLIPTKKTVGQLLDETHATHKLTVTKETAERNEWCIAVVKSEFGSRQLNSLSATDIAGFIAQKKAEGYSKDTINKFLAPLRMGFQIAVREGFVSSSPLDKLLPHERPKGESKRKRAMKQEEIVRLLGATMAQDNRQENLLWKTLFAFLIYTGLRISEALALTWDDIDERYVYVRKSKTEAGIRKVELAPALRSLLRAWKLKQAPGANLVFSTQENGSLSRRNSLRALIATQKRAGISPTYTQHELRHTFASILIAKGEVITKISKQMGHKDVHVTYKTYTHWFEDQESDDSTSKILQDAMGGMI